MCVGLGIASSCEEKGGRRRNIGEHMREVWSRVGFHPEVEGDIVEEDEVAEVEDKNLGATRGEG